MRINVPDPTKKDDEQADLTIYHSRGTTSGATRS